MYKTYRQCQPLPGTHVRVYCLGMRGATADYGDHLGDQRDYEAGRAVGAMLPRRLAKKRATRVLAEHLRSIARWGSRGNMQALIATAIARRNVGFIPWAAVEPAAEGHVHGEPSS